MAKISSSYHEINRLPDGSRVVIRAIRPDDRERLQVEFHKLSSESIRNRFLNVKRNLTGSELDFLTNVDFTSHVALVAELQSESGLQPVGVGRFVRDSDWPERAEFALTVVDACQGRGIGKILLQHLVDCARELGIVHFDAMLFAENRAMLHLLRHSGLALQSANDAGVDTVSLHL